MTEVHYEKKIEHQKCQKIPVSTVRDLIYCLQLQDNFIRQLHTFFDTDEIVKMRNNTILNRFGNYISFSHPVFTFWSHHTSRRLSAQASIRLKEQWEFERVWEVYEYGAQHNKSTSQTMLFISRRAFYTLCALTKVHTGAHSLTDLRREVGKALESRLHSLSSLISF